MLQTGKPSLDRLAVIQYLLRQAQNKLGLAAVSISCFDSGDKRTIQAKRGSESFSRTASAVRKKNTEINYVNIYNSNYPQISYEHDR